MKRNIIYVLCTLFLTSCTSINLQSIFLSSSENSSSFNSINNSINSNLSESESINTSDDGYNCYTKMERKLVKHNLRDANSQLGWITTNTVGNQKFLVIPVQLSDGPSWTKTMLENINVAFFGDSDKTTFESVSSFYNKSSYGNLIIEGEVASPFKANISINSLASYGTECANYIIDKYYQVADSSLLKKYDNDNDGYVDNAVFIYSNSYSNTVDSYWAWCHLASKDNYLYEPSSTKPGFNSYMWASYEYINDRYYDLYNVNKVDAHTYIHETGHMLGLDDYYCSDTSDSWDPAGTLEMQSYNVGDQNIFSKFALGWVDPYYVFGNSRIKLKTSSLYNQAIIIKDNWNNSIFDEYLIIEYYTPTGLNEVDARHRFNGRDKMYDYSGLRIYHVDARLVKLNSQGSFVSYADDFSSSFNYFYYVGASNSYSRSFLNGEYKKLYRYLHLLDQGENNKLNNGKGGVVNTATALWTGGKTFYPSSNFFANGSSFNDGSIIGYSISVSNLTSEDCVVTIEKI